MTINDQRSRGAAVTSADQNGKVFVVLAHDMRLCLICNCAFSRQAAAEHSDRVCYPQTEAR